MNPYNSKNDVIPRNSLGLKNGTCFLYYSNGSIKAEENYLNGIRHGQTILYWYLTHGIASKTYFINGKVTGYARHYTSRKYDNYITRKTYFI